MKKINVMNNVHIDNKQKQNVWGKTVTTIGKLLKVLGIKTKRKDSAHKNSLGSLFFPMKMSGTPFQHISGSKEKALGV